jgi:hypothetical protein
MTGIRNASSESAPAPPMRKKSRRGIPGWHPQLSSQPNGLMPAIISESVPSARMFCSTLRLYSFPPPA